MARGAAERPLTVLGRQLVVTIAAIANVLTHSQARTLADFAKTLKPPTPLHTKRAHWVSLATLEQVADACLVEGRRPFLSTIHTKYPGSRRATQFQCGLMLKLLVRVPLRQRNVRELRLERNLYKDPQTGHWHLHFSGDELKIGHRGAQANEYTMDLSADTTNLVPVLEEFLQVYRPRLPGATAAPFLFLTKWGNPFTMDSLHAELSSAVAMRTGQRFYPHLIRSIWATEYIEKKRDFTGAAYMLGDSVATVLRAYQHVLGKDQHAKAKDFLAEALRTG